MAVIKANLVLTNKVKEIKTKAKPNNAFKTIVLKLF